MPFKLLIERHTLLYNNKPAEQYSGDNPAVNDIDILQNIV